MGGGNSPPPAVGCCCWSSCRVVPTEIVAIILHLCSLNYLAHWYQYLATNLMSVLKLSKIEIGILNYFQQPSFQVFCPLYLEPAQKSPPEFKGVSDPMCYTICLYPSCKLCPHLGSGEHLMLVIQICAYLSSYWIFYIVFLWHLIGASTWDA